MAQFEGCPSHIIKETKKLTETMKEIAKHVDFDESTTDYSCFSDWLVQSVIDLKTSAYKKAGVSEKLHPWRYHPSSCVEVCNYEYPGKCWIDCDIIVDKEVEEDIVEAIEQGVSYHSPAYGWCNPCKVYVRHEHGGETHLHVSCVYPKYQRDTLLEDLFNYARLAEQRQKQIKERKELAKSVAGE